ncbi:MAG: dienelactone hydrolase family protein [Sphingosinicella sp.]
MATIEIAARDGSGRFDAYLAEPAGQKQPARGGIVVIQEIFGVNPGIRRKCDQWASLGYVALAPDLFWRMERGVELDPDIPDQFQRALSLMQGFDQGQGVEDIAATIDEARRRAPGKVGCVGYCLGGRLAFLTAIATDVDASVGYYGVGLDGLVSDKERIRRPVLLHIAGDEHFVPPAQQQAIHAGLDDHPLVTIHDYPGEDHGFAAETGMRRSEVAARLADGRTEAFFAENVG